MAPRVLMSAGDPIAGSRPARAGAGARLAGQLLLATGMVSLASAIAVGATVLAPVHGAWRTAWLVFSTVGLSGQATAPADPQTRLVVAVVAMWMAVAFLLLTVGVLALWRSR